MIGGAMPRLFRYASELPSRTKTNAASDLYNSGTTLSYGRWERNWNRTMPLAMPLVMAREAGKPYGIYCQSFERFQWPSDVMFRPLLYCLSKRIMPGVIPISPMFEWLHEKKTSIEQMIGLAAAASIFLFLL